MLTLAELLPRLNLGAARPDLPRLVLMSDEARLPDPLPLLAALQPGSLVILRCYSDAARRRELAGRIWRSCRARRLQLAVAGDFRLAVGLGCGLHLPESSGRRAPPAVRLWHKKRGGLLTVAAHGGLALRRARRLGADAALLSPVFATASHPDTPPLGALAFRRLVRRAGLPVYALGGVTARRLAQLAGSGAAGVATVGGLNPDFSRSRAT
jgi:thiamine-phosphate pyrophosphorylase